MKPRTPETSWWRFYTTLAMSCSVLLLWFGVPKYANLTIVPLLILALVYPNRTRYVSVLLMGTIVLLTWKILSP